MIIWVSPIQPLGSLKAEEKERSERAVIGFERWRKGLTTECIWPIEARNGPHLTATKNTRTVAV